MRRAFTLIEILVATMLMAMLVTILTMIFNQSSVAWTVGVASLAGLDDARKADAAYASEADGLIRRDGSGGSMLRVVSVWGDDGDTLRVSSGRTVADDLSRLSGVPESCLDDLPTDRSFSIGSGSTQSRVSYVVGVTSWGPDGRQGTWDDITSMPEEVVK